MASTPLKSSIELSAVIPVFNEAGTIGLFYATLKKILTAAGLSYEILFVNDGSTDETMARLLEFREEDPRVKIIDLSRNFGKEIALTAGLDFSKGDAVIPMDADLQDPPEVIPELVSKWKEGYDVVYATRKKRKGDPFIKKCGAFFFYRIIRKITSVEIPPDTGDFRLISRPIVETLKTVRERHRFMKGLFSWVGFRQTSIFFDREPRRDGQTKWNYWKLWNFALEGITSFSYIPLQIASYFGLSVSIFAFIYAIFIIFLKVIHGIAIPGYASLIVAVLFLGGIQLLTLGILGEYIGRIYDETKQRPLYLIKKTSGFEE